MERKNAWEKYSEEDRKKVFDFAEEYRGFISRCKTERECVTALRTLAEKAGFMDMEDVIAKGIRLKPGDRVLAENQGKSMALYVIGQKSVAAGASRRGGEKRRNCCGD